MNNELIKQKSWWKRNWKWFVPLSVILVLIVSFFMSLEISGARTDLAQAYSDTELYNNALEKVKSKQKVIDLLGKIETIDKLAILEGEVHYSNNNQTVNSSIRIKGKAKMDITANKINNKWSYKTINVRIKNPPKKRQTIKIIKAE